MASSHKRLRTCVFPVAGFGTRMLPATKVLPKEMLPVIDKPIVQYALEEAAAAGIERFVMVTGRGKTMIEDHFDRAYELFESLAEKAKTDALAELEKRMNAPGEVIYTRQQEAKGLGHAVWCARHIVGDEPFAVTLVDDLIHGTPCLAEMVEAYDRVGGNIIAVMDVPREQTSRYGIVAPGARDGNLVAVEGLVEKPDAASAPSTLGIVGRYILDSEVMRHLDRHEVGAGGEIQLTDSMCKLIGQQPFHGLEFSGRRFDCGDKLGYLEAIVALALDRPDLGNGMRAMLRRYVA